MLAIQWIDGAKVHRDTVLHDAGLLQNAVQHGKRSSAVNHVVFGDDLKPVDNRLLLQNVTIVRHSQPDPHSRFCKSAEPICWHVSASSFSFSFKTFSCEARIALLRRRDRPGRLSLRWL